VIEAKETFMKIEEKKPNGSKKILLTACPFCTSMLTDAVKTQQIEDEIEILDIVELVNEAMSIKS
jgi:Fe-S oxidoreductase